jgi:enoyl-CoA hydratase/carnithine racemase
MDRDASFETIRLERAGSGQIELTLNRPERANALNTQMGRELLAVFSRLLVDPQDVRCVILTGAGQKAFCAGGDLKEREGMTDEAWRGQHAIFEQAFYALMDCPVPVIAAVNGAAFGGGCELALACDIIYAAEGARFAQTETRLGIIPGGGGTQTLTRAVGARRAKELIFAARPFTAREAFAWGMVNRVCEGSRLLEQARALAEEIAGNAPLAVRQAKRAITVGGESDLKTGLAFEIEAYNRTVTTEDRREGVAAFNEGRRPRFNGR